MMKIKKITTDMRFKDEKGVYGLTKNQYALYVDGKGYVSLDNGISNILIKSIDKYQLK